MATNPSATTTIAPGGSFSKGTGYLTLLGCAELNADGVPRVFTSAAALQAQHGYTAATDYAAMHIEETGEPILFVPLPVATAGTLGRQNDEDVAGTSAITVAAGSNGVLEEVDAVLTVITGGTIGVNGIVIQLSCDGNRTKKTIRLGTATSYAIPYVGITINFAAGTLIAGDVYTFSSTAPKWDGTGIAAARVALAAQQKLTRSWLVIGDLANATEAGYLTTAINAYATSNKRFAFVRANLRDRLPLAQKSNVRKRMTGAPTLTFAEVGASGDTITRSAGSWISDGFAIGDTITVTGSALNNITAVIANLSATVITLGTEDLAAEVAAPNCVVVGSQTLTFAEVGATGDTITRSAGSWVDDGFRIGDSITITGSVSNNVTGTLTGVSALVLTFGSTDLVAEVIGSTSVTITAGETKAAWISALDSAFASVDDQKRIDLAAGRARKLSPITGWKFRRPAAWAVSIREYQHDVHIATFAKELGILDGWDLEDETGTLVEYDETNDGGALAARFTCLRTWGNGPEGAFVAISLTRADENTLLSRTQNMAVANVFCTAVQRATELAVGKYLVLKTDGSGLAEPASLSKIEQRVNTAAKIAVLQSGKEGARASGAKWVANRDSILNIPGAALTGTGFLNLNGTIEKIETSVVVQ